MGYLGYRCVVFATTGLARLRSGLSPGRRDPGYLGQGYLGVWVRPGSESLYQRACEVYLRESRVSHCLLTVLAVGLRFHCLQTRVYRQYGRVMGLWVRSPGSCAAACLSHAAHPHLPTDECVTFTCVSRVLRLRRGEERVKAIRRGLSWGIGVSAPPIARSALTRS